MTGARSSYPESGDRVRVTGGAWQSEIGRSATVVKRLLGDQVVVLHLDGDPEGWTLSLPVEHVAFLPGDMP